MNKKIKIIELLNRIANREEVPRKIIFLNEELEYDELCQDYIGFSKSGGGTLFTYLFTNESTRNFINDRVEILEDNTEEIEKLDLTKEEIIWDKLSMCEDKINELVKAANEIRKDEK